MELEDFVYHFAKYNAVNVSAALLMENWSDDDYDVKYGKYLQEYLNLRELFVGKTDHPAAQAGFDKLRETRTAEIYRDLFDLMVERLGKRKGAMGPAKAEQMRDRLRQRVKAARDVDFAYIHELRRIEEEEY